MKNKNIYLTMEEKRQLALNGKNVPVCISKNNKDSKISLKKKIFNI